MFTSTAARSALRQKIGIAARMYGPTPGSAPSAAGSRGQRPPCCVTIVRAIVCNCRARRLYPKPRHARSTAAGEACASARQDGKVRRNAPYRAATFGTFVCCSIISATVTR